MMTASTIKLRFMYLVDAFDVYTAPSRGGIMDWREWYSWGSERLFLMTLSIYVSHLCA